MSFRFEFILGLLISSSLVGCQLLQSSQPSDQSENSPSPTPPKPTPRKSPTPKPPTVLYVNPEQGKDTAEAGQTLATPFRTLTFALQQAQPNTTIQLSPGKYTAESGETFPIQLKPNVTLQGNEQNRGEGVVITGGGEYVSRTWAGQNVAVLAAKDAKILGLTITNPNTRGTAVWVESTNPLIRHNRLINSHREGVFVSGTGTPVIEHNLFTNNQGNGISVTRNAKGEIRNNIIEQSGNGLSISHTAAPLVHENQIRANLDGLVISESARPVLRGNTISNNRRDGLVAISQAQPDLGTSNNLGKNIFENNGQYDVHNATKAKLLAIGNQLDRKRVAGQVELDLSSAQLSQF